MKMKKILAALLSLCFVVSLAVAPHSYAEELTGTVIYVSVDGNDQNAGTLDAPLATMKGARDKIREIKKSGIPENGITVAFRGGSYKWTETLEFTQEDSGLENAKIIYRSYPGEKAVFEGGVSIPGSQFTEVTDESILMKWSSAKAKQNIRQINIKQIMADNGYTDVYDYYPQEYDWYHHSGTYQENPLEETEGRYTKMRRPIYAFEGELSLWLARYPNREGGKYEDVYPLTKFMKTGDVIQDGGSESVSTFKYNERRISKYAGYEDVYFFGYPKYLFYQDEFKVTIDSENQTISSVGRTSYGVNSNMSYVLFNILDELDAPGEYYIDKNTGIMYVYPNGDIAQKTLNVSLFDKNWMVQMTDTSFVTFSGLEFRNTKGGGILVDGGDSVRFEYSSFENFGTCAIKIGDRTGLPYTNMGDPSEWKDYDSMPGDNWWQKAHSFWTSPEKEVPGQNHGIYGCTIRNTGSYGTYFTGGNLWTEREANFYIENSIIENVGIYQRSGAPAISYDTVHGMVVKDNIFAHSPACLTEGNVSKVLVQGNEFYNGLTEGNDLGIMYFNYQYPSMDVQIIDNYLHDTEPEHEITSSTSQFVQRSGVAHDNSYCGGEIYINNVFNNVPKAVWLRTGALMNSNVFVDCFMPIQYTNAVDDSTANYPQPFTTEEIAKTHAYNRFLMGWPLFEGGELEAHYEKLWGEKYPVVLEWIENVKSGYASSDNMKWFEAKNNLIVNKTMPLYAGIERVTDANTYQGATRHEIVNNVYTDDTSYFVDYANGNVQLNEKGQQEFGNTLDLTTVGPKISMVGANAFATANVALPTATGATVATPSETVPEKVKDAVVLTTQSPNALVRGTMAKVDSQNDQVMPRIIDSRTLVPARFISESFGGVVGWDDAARTVSIEIDGKKVELTIDDANLKVNGEVATVMDVPAQIVENRTMVPLRVLCETVLAKKVFWDPKGLIVISDVENILDSTADAAIVDEIMAILTK